MFLTCLRLIVLTTAISFLFSLLAFTSIGQPVANGDFYIVERSQYLEVSLNDENPAGQMSVTLPMYGGIYICNFCGPGSVPHSPYFTVPGNYLGFDTFQYYYYPVGSPGPNSNTADVSLLLIGNDDAQNAGACRFPLPSPNVGKPINVTNGNMWLEQTDFALPGIGEPVEVKRFYNSIIQTSGLFGLGWSTKYDESLIVYPDNKMIRHNAPDGRASYFGRSTTSTPFTSFSAGMNGQIVKENDNSYTFAYKDGRVHKFSSTGKLLWQKDRNGNQTTLNYNTGGILTHITDPSGRTLYIVTNTNGTVDKICDGLGSDPCLTGEIARYAYITGTNRLETVTYTDGSKYSFEYDTMTVPGKSFLKTVKDALNNALETHVYDSQGRATTSEKHGGVEKYAINYTLDILNRPLTIVTDARGNITKYSHIRQFGTNLVLKTEGACSCGGGGSEVTTYAYNMSNSWLNLVKKN